MLRQTFLHLRGIGEWTEQRFWRRGWRTWDAYLEAADRGELTWSGGGWAAAGVRESALRFQQEDWSWFDRRLPAAHKWRAYGDLADRALYVDIETTGIDRSSAITVLGAFDGIQAHAFVNGVNLEDARAMLAAHPLLVTFNGSQFDLPLIRARFPDLCFNHIHIDLRFVLHRLGLRGGLKRIEIATGLARSERTQGLSGWDAVRLWHEYQRGHTEALDLLLEYNREDVVNLQPLMQLAWERLSRRLAGAEESG